MRRKVVSVVAWLVATIVSILLATAAVGNVGGWSADRAPLQGSVNSLVTAVTATSSSMPPDSPPPTAPPTTSPPTTSPATTAVPTTVATGTDPTTTPPQTTQPPPATSAPATSTTSTSTKAPTTTTTTAAPPAEEYFESRQLTGGWVQLRVSGDSVYLEAAVPEPGFMVRVEHNGPETVEVEFRSESHESKLTARVRDGELDIRTEEETEDD